MSLDATRWAWMQKCSKASDKLVLLALADRAGADSTSWPSAKCISDDTQLNVKTIYSALDRLIALGLIEDTNQRRGSTSQVVVYRLIGVVSRSDEMAAKDTRKRNTPENGSLTERHPKTDSKTPVFSAKTPVFSTKDTQKRVTEPTKNQEEPTKQPECGVDFDFFWDSYPKRTNKRKAKALWESIPSSLHDQIIQHVQHRVVSDSRWVAGYAPEPVAFLTDARWEDEYKSTAGSRPKRNLLEVPDWMQEVITK